MRRSILTAALGCGLAIVAFSSSSDADAAKAPCNRLLTSATWTGSYTLDCALSIPKNITLTIADGSSVNFARALTVEGRLIANNVSFSGTPGLKVASGGRVTISDSTFSNTRVELAGGALMTSSVALTNIQADNTKFIAGAIARPASGTYLISSSTIRDSSVLLVMSRPSQITDSSFSATPIKLVGSQPLMSNNTLASSPLTFGDSNIGSQVTDTSAVSGNILDGSSPLSVVKIKIGGDLSAPSVTTAGVITVPTGTTVSFTDSDVTGTATWVVNGTVRVTGGSFRAARIAVSSIRPTDTASKLILTDTTLNAPVSVGTGASVVATRSALTNSPITSELTASTKRTDEVRIVDSVLTDSPVTLRRVRSALRIDSFDIAATITGSTLATSPIDVWTTAPVAVTANTFTASPVRLAGGSPAVTSNTFTSSRLTLGDNVGWGLATDLINVAANTSSPSNIVTLGRSFLGGSFEGLSLELHLETSVTVPAGRSLTFTDTSITGPGQLTVFGELTMANGTLATARTFVGAASAAAPSAALALTSATLRSDVGLSGGATLVIDNSQLINATIRPSAAPNIWVRPADSVTINDSVLTDSTVAIHRATHLEYPVTFDFIGNTVTRGAVAAVSTDPMTVTGSTFTDSRVQLIGGTPTFSGNVISVSSPVILGETALYAALDTNLASVASNATVPDNTGEVTLGRVTLASSTRFEGFAAVVLPTSWSALAIPSNLEMSLADITVKGLGGLRVAGILNLDGVTLSQASTFVGAASATATQAQLNMSSSTLATTVTIDGGAKVAISASTLQRSAIRYATSPMNTPRTGDGVVVTDSIIDASAITLRRYSPSLVSPIDVLVTRNELINSQVTTWSSGSVTFSNNNATSVQLTVVGGAPYVQNNTFDGTGSFTVGDVVAATPASTLLENVIYNTVYASAAASTKTLTLGRVSLGAWAFDGTDSFATLASTTREVTLAEYTDASIANVTIRGTAPWRIQGALAVSDTTWVTPNLETTSLVASVRIDRTSVSGGSITAGFEGAVTVANSGTSSTALYAGSPKIIFPQPRAANPGTLVVSNSSLLKSPIITQDRATIDVSAATLDMSPVSVQQQSNAKFDTSTLIQSPVTALKTTLSITASTLENSPVSASGGTTTLSAGTFIYVGENTTGITVTAGALVIDGQPGTPVVLSGECDPHNYLAEERCAREAEQMRPARLVSLSNASSIIADNAVFAMARTGVALDPYTAGVAQTELASTSKGIRDSDFVATNDAVTFAPVWSIMNCSSSAYLPVTDSYFHQGHQWNVTVTPTSSMTLASYLAGTADFSGFKRGTTATNFTTGVWLGKLTTGVDTGWSAPGLSSYEYGSFVFDSVLAPAAHAAVPPLVYSNMLPYPTQACSFPVPTTPIASAIGIPVAAPRLTTPVVPWSSQTNDIELDGENTARHEYTTSLAGALGLNQEWVTTTFVQSPIPVLMLPHADVERVHNVAGFTPQASPVPGPLSLSRTLENNPVLIARWGAPATPRVVGYHVELSRDGTTWQRLTPAAGIPGRYNTMHHIDCSFTDDCYVRIVTIGFDGESIPGESVLKPKAPWAK